MASPRDTASQTRDHVTRRQVLDEHRPGVETGFSWMASCASASCIGRVAPAAGRTAFRRARAAGSPNLAPPSRSLASLCCCSRLVGTRGCRSDTADLLQNHPCPHLGAEERVRDELQPGTSQVGAVLPADWRRPAGAEREDSVCAPETQIDKDTVLIGHSVRLYQARRGEPCVVIPTRLHPNCSAHIARNPAVCIRYPRRRTRLGALLWPVPPSS